MTPPPVKLSDSDRPYLQRAIALALEAERRGNLPIGAVITCDGEVLAEGANAMFTPFFHPGRHAETEALRRVPASAWLVSRKLTCYSTLEPCLMCLGSLILHRVGRIVYGAADTLGGAGGVLDHLPPYLQRPDRLPSWIGPVLPDPCDELFERAQLRFSEQPGE